MLKEEQTFKKKIEEYCLKRQHNLRGGVMVSQFVKLYLLAKQILSIDMQNALISRPESFEGWITLFTG